MDPEILRARAERLRALHVPGRPLVLVNAWDAASAVLIARAGAKAVATTSAGAANALGYADGQHLTRSEMLAAVAPIARAVELPVTADMEAGYGDDPEAAAATANGVLDAGAVGLNLEDTSDRSGEELLPIDEFVAKIAAVRAVGVERGVPLVLNARTDVFIGAVGDPATRLDRAVERGLAYLAAGADCIFVPDAPDGDTIGRARRTDRRAGQRPRRGRLAVTGRAGVARRRPHQCRFGRLSGHTGACAPDRRVRLRSGLARADDRCAGAVRRAPAALRPLTPDLHSSARGRYAIEIELS